MIDFRADLHCHSTCSDGTLTPEEIVKLAKENGLSGLSITDHDTVAAYSLALPTAKELGIELMSGVEFSTALHGTSVHLLGYGFDADNLEILSLCERHRERRQERNAEILTLLTKHNMPISEEELFAAVPPKDSHTIGRPHIALAMVKKGYVDSIQTAFKKFIGEGKPCFSAGRSFEVQEAIDIIHQAKGIAVIAHPHLMSNQSTLNALIKFNFDGIECYYGHFPVRDHKRWLKIAEKKGWLITGGSDFHGTVKPASRLGSSWIGQDLFNILKERLASA